jgi:4-hydroxybenzoate polyprenyltransferase
MTVRTALKLGRVSNLPTVWTNVLAGTAFATLEPDVGTILPVAVACSLLYIAGMFLNDAFDRRWDAEHRPERPIPAGEVEAATVFRMGFGMIAAALIVLFIVPQGPRSFLAGLALTGLILLYDVSHKKNPVAPIVMALCRVAVYATASFAAAPAISPPLVAGSAFLFMYLVSLTLVAREEDKNPKLRRVVGLMIAGISIIDGLQLLVLGHKILAGLCIAAFLLTLRLQRRIAGT